MLDLVGAKRRHPRGQDRCCRLCQELVVVSNPCIPCNFGMTSHKRLSIEKGVTMVSGRCLTISSLRL
jgi:hypothetical protein